MAKLDIKTNDQQVELSQIPDVFNFLDFREYLKAYYRYKRSLNPNFSYTVFGRKASLSQSLLLSIVNGRRNLMGHKASGIAAACALNEWETEYFISLVLWNQGKDEKIREIYWEKIIKLIPKTNFHIVEKAQEKVYERWYWQALLELVRLKDFRMDSSWIAKRFQNRVTPEQVQETLNLMIQLGFLKQKNDIWEISEEKFYTDGTHISPEMIRNFHKKNIPLGVEAIDKVKNIKRAVATISVALNEKEFSKLKEKINDFCGEVLETTGEGEDATEVYQMNIQFFPITVKSGGAE